MQAAMHASFGEAALRGRALLADAGSAFLESGNTGLWDLDGVHPFLAGSALAAGVFAEAIAGARGAPMR